MQVKNRVSPKQYSVIVVERHHIKGTREMLRLCSLSKELYNKCNFQMRKAWREGATLPNIQELIRETQHLDCFKNLHNTKTAKQTIRRCLTDWTNFKKARNAYFKDQSKFIRMPKAPGYKKKLAQITFYIETIKGGQSGRPLTQIIPTNNLFSIPSDKPFKQVVVTPMTFGFVIEVQYEKPSEKAKTKKSNVCSIDLGLNNLATIASDQHSPILINGRIVKSFNRFYNKNSSQRASKKRYWRLENYFHQVSKIIVQNCIQHQIGTIVIGRNDGWKTGSRLGRKNNQNFQSVPFNKLIEKIQYKAQAAGIDVTLTEEAYTSKASFLDRDEVPQYEKGVERTFSGTRIKRGLYRSSKGVLLNADVNGAANIGRKVFPNAAFGCEWDRSVAATPVAVNPLRQTCA